MLLLLAPQLNKCPCIIEDFQAEQESVNDHLPAIHEAAVFAEFLRDFRVEGVCLVLCQRQEGFTSK